MQHDPNVKTQKARGVLWLKHRGFSVPHVVVWTATERPAASYPAFARPCPVTPRHGFVDSRIVKNEAEAAAVYAEALAADPEAELMLMRPIAAEWNAVVTPRMAAIGRGHDGATGGKVGVINLPLTHVGLPENEDLVPAGQVPYLEVVYAPVTFGDVKAHIVQLRSGPALDGAGVGDFVPTDVVVAHVLNAHDLDPMALEAALAVAAPGTVVWQASGSPCSHAACHARLNNVAITFGEFAPAVGSTLHATGNNAPIATYAFAAAVRGAALLNKTLQAPHLWAVHQAVDLVTTPEGAAYVAQACATIWRHAAAAVVAEARHSLYSKTGKRRVRRQARDTFYATLLSKPAIEATLRSRCKAAAELFGRSDYWSSGYGGEKWEGCANAALRLYNALSAVTQPESVGDADVRAVIAAAHGVVNAAHNNGPFLNKFVGSCEFDNAANGDLNQTLYALADVAKAAPVVAGPAWPRRRSRDGAAGPTPRTLAAVLAGMQWNYRQDGAALHVQHGTCDAYASATIPMALLTADARRIIEALVASTVPTLPSLAGTEKRYWPAAGILDAAAVHTLFPNLEIV